MGNEKEFSKRARGALKRAGCAVYPVETGATGVGFPDLVVLHEGGASFVELKCRPSIVLARLSGAGIEGPGQRAFSRQLARRSAIRRQGIRISERSFVLVECMDGVALLAGEESCHYLAACWEGLPSGEDLRDALRAWRISCSPDYGLASSAIEECYCECASMYGYATGIAISLAGIKDGELTLEEAGGKEKAIEIARDICDRGRIALLELSMKADIGKKREVPLEEGNGYIILSKEE